MTDDNSEYVQSLQGIVIVRVGMGSGKSTIMAFIVNASYSISAAHRTFFMACGNVRRKSCVKADIPHYQGLGYQETAPYATDNCWQPLSQHLFCFDDTQLRRSSGWG
ncbi:hypothetical protein [Escherichia coli]|uniref:hypothetical protein n=1 Tax=Escherichia coli TaxID=562 RepID=UPI0039748411